MAGSQPVPRFDPRLSCQLKEEQECKHRLAAHRRQDYGFRILASARGCYSSHSREPRGLPAYLAAPWMDSHKPSPHSLAVQRRFPVAPSVAPSLVAPSLGRLTELAHQDNRAEPYLALAVGLLEEVPDQGV